MADRCLFLLKVYHLACFACDSCKRQLSTGEEFGIHENRVLCKSHYVEIIDGVGTSSDGKKWGKVYSRGFCWLNAVERASSNGKGRTNSYTLYYDGLSHSCCRERRVLGSPVQEEDKEDEDNVHRRANTDTAGEFISRTSGVLTFSCNQIFSQANFQIDSNPDGQDLERIAQITGLSKRVTQVWFQNCRARQKKYMNSGKSRNQSKNKGNANLAHFISRMSEGSTLIPLFPSLDFPGSKSVPLSGLSPIPRDQCSTPQQLDLHVMYSTFRAQPPATSSGKWANLFHSTSVPQLKLLCTFIFRQQPRRPVPRLQSQQFHEGRSVVCVTV